MQISHKIREKRGKRIDAIVDNVEYCLCGLCTFPNVAINANIARKSWGKREKNNRHNVDCC